MRMTEQITYRLSKSDREALMNIAKEKNTTIGKLLRQLTKPAIYEQTDGSI